MAFCDNERCPRPDEPVDGDGETAHVFCGYMISYHPECCLLRFDGTMCTLPHPLDLAANPSRSVQG